MADWFEEGGAAALNAGIKGFAEAWQNAEDRDMKKIEMNAKAEALKHDQERQEFMDGLTARHQGFKPQGGRLYDQDPASLSYDPEYLRMQEQKANADPFGLKSLQLRNAQMDLNKKNQEAQQAAKGFKLPPDKVLQVQSGAQIPTQLSDIEQTLEANKPMFGPVRGRVGAANPYDEGAQTIDAQFRAASQTFGRYMEGGVLRKEDEEKYRKMFPQLSDTPEVAKNKLAIVRKLLVDKQNADVEALSAQGYDTTGFRALPPGQNPGLLTKGLVKKTGLLESALPAAQASDQSAGPKPGDVQDGYQFIGGSPADPKSWKKVEKGR